jgi:hypothetical protein
VPGIQGGVEYIGGMSAFAQRDFDGIFLVRFTSSIVALIQLKPMSEISPLFSRMALKETCVMCDCRDQVVRYRSVNYTSYKKFLTYRVVKLRYPSIRDWQPRQANKVY